MQKDDVMRFRISKELKTFIERELVKLDIKNSSPFIRGALLAAIMASRKSKKPLLTAKGYALSGEGVEGISPKDFLVISEKIRKNYGIK